MDIYRKLQSRINAFLSNPQLHQWGSQWSINKVLIVSLGLTGIIFGVRQIGVLQGWELQAFDSLVKSRLSEEPDNRLLVVGITDNYDDLSHLTSGKISDKKLAEVITILQENNVAVIGLDIFRDIPIGEGLADLNDAFQDGNIIAACGMSDAKNSPGIKPPSDINPGQVGFLTVIPDNDDTIRRTPLISQPPERQYPEKHLCNDPDQTLQSLAFLVARYYLPEDINIEVPTDNTPLKIGKAEFKRLKSNTGGYRNLEDGDYQILLNYRSHPEPIEIVSLSDLINRQVDAKIKDRAVLIGYTGESFKDTFSTPYTKNAITPGVLIHAQIASQIISAVEDGRPPQILSWDEWQEFLWIWVWAVVGGLVTWRRFPTWLVMTLGVVTCGGLIVVCWVGLNFFAYWLPMIPSFLVLVGTGGIVFARERINIKEIDWDSVREEENKKKEQAEKIARREFLQKLQTEAYTLKQQLKQPEIQDSYNHKNVEVYSGNWLDELQEEAKKMRKHWTLILTQPFAQEKESINALLKRSEYLLNSYQDPNT